MQYLLTEEEMEAVRAHRRDVLALPGGGLANHLEALANVCKRIATEFTPEGDLERARGCIHVKHPDGPGYQTRYCDHCPVASICPLKKEWSK